MEVLRSELPHVHYRVLRDMPDARSNDADGEEERASSCRPAHLAQNKFASLLLREARRDHRCRDDGLAASDGEGVMTYRKNDQLRPPHRAIVVVEVKPECCVLCFFTKSKHSSPVEIGTNSTYLHAQCLKSTVR